MRFSTENEALDYLIGKEVRDAENPNTTCITQSRSESKGKFDKWIERKRLMFSPQEFEALQGKMQNQSVRDHHGNTFADWVEDKPRRRAIIIVDAAWQTEANNVAKGVDKIGGDRTFIGLGLSETGKEPATYFWCNWNCSASEFEFFNNQKMPWWRVFEVFEGEDVDEVILGPNGLKRIERDLIATPKGLQ